MTNKEFAQSLCLKSTLMNLTEGNVSEVYNQNYDRWRYRVSDTVIVNGEDVSDSSERAFLQYHERKGKPNIESLTMSMTVGGIPVTEKDFILEETEKHQAKYEKVITDRAKNLSLIKKLEIYLNYLKQRKVELVRSLPEDNQVFDERILNEIHTRFNDGTIWKKIFLVDFIQSFQGLGNKIDPITATDFCYLLGLIQEMRVKHICPNYANWVQSTFNIKNYINLKVQTPDSNTKTHIRTEFSKLQCYKNYIKILT